MKIIPLAFDSLGVRSESTFVQTNDAKILIDPSAALGPRRYGLPPHPLEWKKLEESLKIIREYAKISDVVIISHYHYDHYNPGEPDLLKDKKVYLKHPEEKINKSQYGRAKEFLPQIEGLVKQLEFADGKELTLGKTKVKFSPPTWHGREKTQLGYVIMISIEDGKEKLVYSSDAEGPVSDGATNWIISENPDVLIQDGIATLFFGWRESPKLLEYANKNCIRILEETKVKKLVLDHHLVRDLKYKEKIKPVLERAKELKKEVITAAEFAGLKPEFLEAHRKDLYKQYPDIKLSNKEKIILE